MTNTFDVFAALLKMRVLLILYSLIVSSVEKNEVYVIQNLSNSIGAMVLACQSEVGGEKRRLR